MPALSRSAVHVRALRWVLVALLIVLLAVAFLPLRVAVGLAGLDDEIFSARAMTGTVWNGRIEEARAGPFALGDLDARTQVWPLLIGQVKLDLSRAPLAGNRGFRATVGGGSGDLHIDNATADLALGDTLAPLPAARVALDDVHVRTANGRCVAAGGAVRMTLDANIPGLDLQQGLLGRAACDDGAVALALASGSGMEKLTIGIEPDRRYLARLFLSGGDATWALLLPALGFERVVGGYALRVDGRL